MADLTISSARAAQPAIAPVRFPELDRAAEPFGATLGRAVTELDGMQRQAEDAAVALAAGKSVDTAQSVAQVEKANIAFQFALSIRNKLLEAYQDVMRMPV